ncbi:class I SAM-dependent methyltransferase [Adonisia turfae]|uniref:Class I SAM-dependent methyltransferase n=1 Tax=Adonisia turfae CCMR0081 TaxID=2292702 RepID=A0A6M0RIW7_9CYAN|nr:class I SAM-dependent methyltransferase [Adonisia turfae]NEZ56144.1 class I SAM-dependent methyltransferase [Adonisia turfae CCMR0081]
MTVQEYEVLNAKQIASETDPFTEERYRQFYKFFSKKYETVLDVGCNTGRGGHILKQCNSLLKIAGLDCVQDRLDRLSKNIYAQTFYGLSTDIPVSDRSFDVVVAGEFIEHLYPNDVDKTLGEFFRVLKIGGRLMLTTPNPEDYKKRLRKESVLGEAHVSQHFPHALKCKLQMMGYRNIRLFGSGKVTRYLGYYFPIHNIYGSYLIIADKE